MSHNSVIDISVTDFLWHLTLSANPVDDKIILVVQYRLECFCSSLILVLVKVFLFRIRSLISSSTSFYCYKKLCIIYLILNFFFFKAILAAAAPDIAPFMADECLLAIPEIEGIDYTTKEYLNFVWHIQNTADRLSKECKYDKFYFLFFFV